jgi:hypothetical protein
MFPGYLRLQLKFRNGIWRLKSEKNMSTSKAASADNLYEPIIYMTRSHARGLRHAFWELFDALLTENVHCVTRKQR